MQVVVDLPGKWYFSGILSTAAPINPGQRKPVTSQAQPLDAFDLVIFGGTGDLARRKLLPALLQRFADGQIVAGSRIVATARDVMSSEDYRQRMATEIAPALDDEARKALQSFMRLVEYRAIDATREDGWTALEQLLSGPAERVRVFYLATGPDLFVPICERLRAHGLSGGNARVVIEKPIGRDLTSALKTNDAVGHAFDERQTFRIDHYLGKETVQNVLVLRFANSIFEPIWNRQWIHHVQITAAETVGVEERGKYYEEAGVVRDMFQNHLLQLLSLTAMEPPAQMSANAVRDEKVKVLRSVRWLSPETIPDNAVRAQYTAGSVGGKPVPGYTQEKDVASDSRVPTFAAVRLFVDNWRWNGVPFYLRSGKRMAKRASEIAVQFRSPPHLMFGHLTREAMRPNTLVMRVQPNEGVALNFEVKVPGAAVALTSNIEIAPVDMEFDYANAFGEVSAPAYETLLLDVMIGEATLFTRSDEVEAAWRVIDPLIQYWEANKPKRMPGYAAGSWGPREADELIEEDGVEWREP